MKTHKKYKPLVDLYLQIGRELVVKDELVKLLEQFTRSSKKVPVVGSVWLTRGSCLCFY